MNLSDTILEQAILTYSIRLPYHPGKWRVVGQLLRWARVDRHYAGRECLANRNGVQWQLALDDWVQRTLYYHGSWDDNEVKYAIAQLRPGSVFLDVGSHFGYYSLMIARAHGDAVRCFAFEPVPGNHARLTQNIRLNGFARVEAVKSAVSDSTGELEFELPPARNMGSGHLNKRSADGETVVVPVITLDSFVQQRALERVDLIKIDIEGMELSALRGATSTLRDHRPQVLMELNPPALREQGSSAAQLIEYVGDMGYATYELHSNGLRNFSAADLGRPDLVAGYTNLVCKPAR